MSVSLEYLERCAAETGFPVAGLEQVVRLGEMAAQVARHPLLSETLVLKGGTALNLAFGPPERLSVDLDFNYVGAVERERMLAERPRVEHALGELARRSGYRVQQSAQAFAGRKLHLHYRSALGPEARIEVDLNFLLRLPLSEAGVRELWQPGELDRPRLRVVGSDELLIGKLCALLDRCAVRDAWDVANLAPEVAAAFEGASFRGRFVALAGILDHSPATYRQERFAHRLTQRAVDGRSAARPRRRAPRGRSRRRHLGQDRALAGPFRSGTGLRRPAPPWRTAASTPVSRRSRRGRAPVPASGAVVEGAQRACAPRP